MGSDDINIAYNMDCLAAMLEMPDKAFDLAVVDPPYGIGISNNPVRQAHDKKNWDKSIPSKEYFDELFRVSKNQIIWGGNYYDLPPTQNLIVWDKKQPEDFSLAMCEFAWCSIQMPAKIFSYSVLNEKGKIHPTQKPVALYRWIFNRYAKPGDKILDTHLGSGSSRIAAYDAGLDFAGYEIDKEYFDKQEERYQRYISQISLFVDGDTQEDGAITLW